MLIHHFKPVLRIYLAVFISLFSIIYPFIFFQIWYEIFLREVLCNIQDKNKRKKEESENKDRGTNYRQGKAANWTKKLELDFLLLTG